MELLVPEADAAARGINFEDLNLHAIPLVEHFFGALDAAPAQIADVDEPFDARLDFHEGSKVREVRDSAGGTSILLPALGHRVPGIALELFHAERNAVRLFVDVDDANLHDIALLHEILGLGVALPREFGVVNEPLHRAEVHEDPEGGDAAHRPLTHIAHHGVLVEGSTLGGHFFFQNHAAGEDKAALLAVLLQKFHIEVVFHEATGIDAPSVLGKMGDGNESLDAAAVHDEATFDLADPPDTDDIALAEGFLHGAPPLVELRTPAAHDELGFFVLHDIDHLDAHRVSHMGLRGVLHQRPMGPLLAGQMGLALVAHIQEPAVLDRADDNPFDQLAPVNVLGRILVNHALHRFAACFGALFPLRHIKHFLVLHFPVHLHHCHPSPLTTLVSRVSI